MENAGFSSKLSTGELRFLAEALEHSFACGRRTADDFIRHFPPETIMDSLDQQPRLRATFLAVLVGLREKTAIRTPASDAGRLLQAALEEGDTDPEAIVSTFEPDDRIRFLPPTRIWAFLTEGEFWKVSRSKDSAGHKMAQAHLAYLLERALAHGLVSHTDVIDGISVELLADKLPRAELTKILRRALDLGRAGTAFRQADFYEATPATVLVDHVALPQIFDTVILPVARSAGYVETPKTRDEPPALSTPAPSASSAPKETTKPTPKEAAKEASPSQMPWAEDGSEPPPAPDAKAN
jgi:hypothetical protein